VRVQSCPEAADFVALAVTLAVDPDGANALGEETRSPSEQAAPALQADEEQVKAQPGEGASSHSAPFRLGVQAGAIGSAGALPNVALGFEAGVVSTLGPWQLRTAFRWYPAQEITVPGVPTDFGPIAFEVLGGALALGYRTRVRWLVLIPTLTVEVAQMSRLGSRELWIRLEGGLELTLARTTPLEPFLALGLSVPLSNPSFDLYGNLAAHRVGLGGAAALGLRVFFVGP
jgi:hypothetical protein